jgi:hypothetical protein
VLDRANAQCVRAAINGACGLRHQCVQSRYEAKTGCKCPVASGPNRKQLAGEQRSVDARVSMEISLELGHSRLQIVAVYLGRQRNHATAAAATGGARLAELRSAKAYCRKSSDGGRTRGAPVTQPTREDPWDRTGAGRELQGRMHGQHAPGSVDAPRAVGATSGEACLLAEPAA